MKWFGLESGDGLPLTSLGAQMWINGKPPFPLWANFMDSAKTTGKSFKN